MQLKKLKRTNVLFFIARKFSYVSRTKTQKVKFVEYLTKFVNNLLTIKRL